jgi:hypothetical protein
MGAVTFEAALLDAAARLATGEDEVQVTAGDEAIERAAWADPAHCTHDFCGSLRLGRPGAAPDAPVLSVRFHDAADADRVAAGLATDALVRDLSAAGGPDDATLPGGARNPCAGLWHLLAFLADPSRSGTWAWQKAGPDGDCYTVAARKAAR